MRVIAYDPFAPDAPELSAVERAEWPQRLPEADFIAMPCALTASSRHLVNAEALAQAKVGLRVVNVGRGPVSDEPALEAALESGQVYSVALDVFEVEPLPMDSYLRQHPRCVFGSHKASNTADAMVRLSEIAIGKLANFFS